MRILIADDSEGIRSSLGQLLKRNHDIILCEDGEVALKTLEKNIVDLVVTDYMMPNVSGLELIRKGKELAPDTAFVLITAHASLDQAIEALRLGADDYFTKPFDLSEIAHRVGRIEELLYWKAEKLLRTANSADAPLVGQPASLEPITQFIQKAAGNREPVLLNGPRGSDPIFLSKKIHEASFKSIRPLVILNCSTAIRAARMEADLFGGEKGSSPHPAQLSQGGLALASGGTLVLHEISTLDLDLQRRLFDAIQKKEFTRIGGGQTRKLAARIIATSSVDLKKRVEEKQFSAELYDRLIAQSYALLPLAQRAGDVEPLIKHHWNDLNIRYGLNLELAPETLQRLVSYRYPKNVAELKNVLESLILRGEGNTVGPDLLPEYLSKGGV